MSRRDRLAEVVSLDARRQPAPRSRESVGAPLTLDLAALVRALADLPDDHLRPLLDRLGELRGAASSPE